MEGDKQDLAPISIHPKAYRFFPKREEEKSAFEKKGSRFYFYGQIEHDEYEVRKIKEFHEYVLKKQKKYNKQFYSGDHLILQLLSANKYKPKETLKAMKQHEEFKLTYVPNLSFQKIEPVLKTGFYYLCGRDYRFRPILVYKIKLVDKSNYSAYFDASVYVQEEIIKKMILPGQVQSWKHANQRFANFLNEIYLVTGRLHRLWVVNAPSGVSTAWKIVSTFLDDVTVEKINISKTNSDKSIFETAHPSQIQMKYGGTQPNRTEFYPLKIPQGVFDQKRLTSDQQYQKLLKSGKLSRNIIDPLFSAKKQ